MPTIEDLLGQSGEATVEFKGGLKITFTYRASEYSPVFLDKMRKEGDGGTAEMVKRLVTDWDLQDTYEEKADDGKVRKVKKKVPIERGPHGVDRVPYIILNSILAVITEKQTPNPVSSQGSGSFV